MFSIHHRPIPVWIWEYWINPIRAYYFFSATRVDGLELFYCEIRLDRWRMGDTDYEIFVAIEDFCFSSKFGSLVEIRSFWSSAIYNLCVTNYELDTKGWIGNLVLVDWLFRFIPWQLLDSRPGAWPLKFLTSRHQFFGQINKVLICKGNFWLIYLLPFFHCFIWDINFVGVASGPL